MFSLKSKRAYVAYVAKETDCNREKALDIAGPSTRGLAETYSKDEYIAELEAQLRSFKDEKKRRDRNFQ